MRFGKFEFKNVYFVTVEKGEDLKAALQEFVDKVGIKQAVLLCGIGVQDGANLYEVIGVNPSVRHYEQLEGPVELCSIQGNVIDGAVHIHAVVSTDKGVYAGHVEPGNKSLGTMHVLIADFTGDRIVRRPNPAGGTLISFEQP